MSAPLLAAAVPPAAPGGTQSLNTAGGAILDGTSAALSNATVFTAGGFNYHLAFMWNGTDSTSFGHTEKLIDYSGTESLQLVTTAGSASLQMTFGDDLGAETIPVSTTILPNTWYDTTVSFAATSTTAGDVSGTASLYVNGSLVSSGSATKGTYGDGLNRPIGVGQLGANFGYLVGFKGDIYDPSVNLGSVPEPSTLALGGDGQPPRCFAPVGRPQSLDGNLMITKQRPPAMAAFLFSMLCHVPRWTFAVSPRELRLA